MYDAVFLRKWKIRGKSFSHLMHIYGIVAGHVFCFASCWLFCWPKIRIRGFSFFLLFASNVGNGSDATAAAAADDDNVIASCRRKSCGRKTFVPIH